MPSTCGQPRTPAKHRGTAGWHGLERAHRLLFESAPPTRAEKTASRLPVPPHSLGNDFKRWQGFPTAFRATMKPPENAGRPGLLPAFVRSSTDSFQARLKGRPTGRTPRQPRWAKSLTKQCRKNGPDLAIRACLPLRPSFLTRCQRPLSEPARQQSGRRAQHPPALTRAGRTSIRNIGCRSPPTQVSGTRRNSRSAESAVPREFPADSADQRSPCSFSMRRPPNFTACVPTRSVRETGRKAAGK